MSMYVAFLLKCQVSNKAFFFYFRSKLTKCNCTDGNTLKVNFQAIDPEELKEVKDRRKAELQKFKRRLIMTLQQLILLNQFLI